MKQQLNIGDTIKVTWKGCVGLEETYEVVITGFREDGILGTYQFVSMPGGAEGLFPYRNCTYEKVKSGNKPEIVEDTIKWLQSHA